LRHRAHWFGHLEAERIARRVSIGLVVAAGLCVFLQLLRISAEGPGRLFADAELYSQATAAWLAGGDPWTVTVSEGIRFVGIPPTLLVSLPLQPFGPDMVRPFWGLADLLAWGFILRRLSLPVWMILFPPFWDAWFPGNPDPVLLALVILGGGALAGLVKPYSIPAMLAERRWRAVTLAAALGLASLPLLPWGMFVASLPAIVAAIDEQSLKTSAFGNWPLFVAAGVALLSLGPRTALSMAVPVLWPAAQLHYGLFSIDAARRSPALAACLCFPHAAAPGVIVFAVAHHWRRLLDRRGAGPLSAPGAGVPSG